MSISKIEWTETTWNPITGCTKISDGCKFCYAEKMSFRLQAMGIKKYSQGFKLKLHPELIIEPYSWKKSRLVFVNSMSDLFHEDVPFSFIKKVFVMMNQTPQHTYQILTKRADNLKRLASKFNWTKNIWIGVTVENFKVLDRIDLLRAVDAKIRFISFEPLLTFLPNMNLNNIHWAIVGGESGLMARHMEKEWVLDILEQCRKSGVKFFFKQWGGANKKKNGRLLNGMFYNEMPV